MDSVAEVGEGVGVEMAGWGPFRPRAFEVVRVITAGVE